jgi:hypothetical protein
VTKGFAITLTTPVMIPAAPKPAIPRPMMKTTEFGAAPQIVEPISKSRITDNSVLLMLKNE